MTAEQGTPTDAEVSLKWLPVPPGYVSKFGDVTDPESWFGTTMAEDSACDHCVRLLRDVNGHELYCLVHGPQWVARTLENALLWITALQGDHAILSGRPRRRTG